MTLPQNSPAFWRGWRPIRHSKLFSHTLRYSENTHEIDVEFYLLFSILAIQNINSLEKRRLILFHKPK